MGAHTSILVEQSKRVIASDISCQSLDVLLKRFPFATNLETIVCDMEKLPFPAQSFDLVACAGGLSYGDNRIVRHEIYRVLRPGGYFVCIDSLNHNPIYKLNRLIHYLRGHRSLSTLKRMPKLSLIDSYQSQFSSVYIKFYGAFSWILAPVSRYIGEANSFALTNRLDSFFKTRKLAFKFVLSVQKPLSCK